MVNGGGRFENVDLQVIKYAVSRVLVYYRTPSRNANPKKEVVGGFTPC